MKGERTLSYGPNATVMYHERFNGPFLVRIPITINAVDTSSIRASLNEGVLTIEVTRFDAPPSKRIKISSDDHEATEEAKTAPAKAEDSKTEEKTKSESKVVSPVSSEEHSTVSQSTSSTMEKKADEKAANTMPKEKEKNDKMEKTNRSKRSTSTH